MKSFGLYAASCVVIIALLGAILWGFLAPASQQAMLWSAGLALVVQLVAFAVAVALRQKHMLLGWGLGSLLRLVVLVIYAVAVAKVWRLPLAPALLSLVGFLFVTTVVEPVFLKR